MIPITQGSLPRSFKAIQVGRPAVDRVDRRPSKINESWAKSHVHVMGQNEAYDTRKPPKKFQGHPSRSPGGRPRGSPSTQNQSPMGQLFFYAESHVHMLGQNDPYDTRKPPREVSRPSESVARRSTTWIAVHPKSMSRGKPPKKFQGNPTCARLNLRWTTTWIASGRRPPKINHPWVNFFSRQNLTCICRVKMIPITQGSLPRSFKAIRVGRPVVDHVDCRPPKINHPWPITQGNLPRSFKAIRLARGQIFDGRRLGSPSVAVHPKSITHGQNLTCICSEKMIPMTQGSLPRSFKAIRVGRPVVDHVDRRPSKINESWAESHVHVRSQNDPYDTTKPPKKFQGHPSRSSGGRPRGSPSIKNQ
ncbi:uncharacterized protein G2W53_040026 [Senna tora]|uniref:Uncharacterized protein n=1 Tax=Senna tora TaxID=362788 RepID=A0A834SNS8_9FABA|nr:uncharacterized protein G2W53_040026 [Senna tora]